MPKGGVNTGALVANLVQNIDQSGKPSVDVADCNRGHVIDTISKAILP